MTSRLTFIYERNKTNEFKQRKVIEDEFIPKFVYLYIVQLKFSYRQREASKILFNEYWLFSIFSYVIANIWRYF